MKNLTSLKDGEMATRIRNVRANVLKMNQKKFAEAVQVNQATVSKWESRQAIPESRQLMQIAILLGGTEDALYFLEVAGVPTPYLASEREYKESIQAIEAGNVLDIKPSSIISVPLLRYGVRSVTDAIVSGDVQAYLPFLSRLVLPSASLIVFHFVGTSMVPLLCDGYLVVIDTNQRDPVKLAGKLIAIKDAAGITVRWLRRDRDVYFLLPEQSSDQHPVRVWNADDQETTIEGAVIQWTGFPPEGKK